jgi:hypothetical protein
VGICDALVHKALEKIGMYQLKADRSRFREVGGLSLASVHTLYPASDETVSKVLRGAWDVLPGLLREYTHVPAEDDAALAKALEAYVQDLAVTGSVPQTAELAYRIEKALGPVLVEAAS